MQKLWEKIQPQIVHNSNSKGFWNREHSSEINIALIASELGEAMESLRHEKRAVRFDNTERDDLFNVRFKECRKDTLDDEIADSFIRAIDISGNLDIAIKTLSFDIRQGIVDGYEKAETSFGMLLDIMGEVAKLGAAIATKMNAHHIEYRLAVVLTKLEVFASIHKIDIEESILLKMRYNSSRPFLHGKTC